MRRFLFNVVIIVQLTATRLQRYVCALRAGAMLPFFTC